MTQEIAQAAAEYEQARIVAYIRETQAIFQKRIDDGVKPLLNAHHRDSCKYMAQAIEQGEHWR